MLTELFSSGTLNLVYAGMLLISFAFALLTLFGAELGEAFDFNVDVDADGGFDFVSISPFSLAMFGATFGLAGLITRLWLDMGTIPSILWASGFGLAIGLAAQALFIYVLSPSKSSHFSLSDDAVGREAEVIITIPENGRGTIAFDNVSGRVTLGAHSIDNKLIPNGQFVKIERITGRVAFVSPIEEK